MTKAPRKKDLPAPDVRAFRLAIQEGYKRTDSQGRVPSKSKYGVYVFYDFEDEPIYVGQTVEGLSTRVNRHLTNQRTDAVGMRVLDPYEIKSLELWPVYEVPEGVAIKQHIDRLELTVYRRAISLSKFGMILNEKVPPIGEPLSEEELPEPLRVELIDPDQHPERVHPDNRIARRAESLNRLANVIRERGEVTNDLRRVLVIQAVRLGWIAAERLAEASGIEPPPRTAMDLAALAGDPVVNEDEEE